MLLGPSRPPAPVEDGEPGLASSPWDWGVVIDDERDTIPAPSPAEGDDDDVVLERP